MPISSLSMLFGSVQPLISKAHHSPIAQDELPQLHSSLQTAKILADFEGLMQRTTNPLITRRVADGPQSSLSASIDEDISFFHRYYSNNGGGAGHVTSSQPTGPTHGMTTANQFTSLEGTSPASAAASSLDRIRLYLCQGYSLMSLATRLCQLELIICLFIGIIRTASVLLQVWALWSLIRIANNESSEVSTTQTIEVCPFNTSGAPCGALEVPAQPDDYAQYLIALCIPLAAFIQVTLQSFTTQIGTHASLRVRGLVVALVFEKLKVLTPVYLGGAAGGGRGGKRKSKLRAKTTSIRVPSDAEHKTASIDVERLTGTLGEVTLAALIQPSKHSENVAMLKISPTADEETTTSHSQSQIRTQGEEELEIALYSGYGGPIPSPSIYSPLAGKTKSGFESKNSVKSIRSMKKSPTFRRRQPLSALFAEQQESMTIDPFDHQMLGGLNLASSEESEGEDDSEEVEDHDDNKAFQASCDRDLELGKLTHDGWDYSIRGLRSLANTAGLKSITTTVDHPTNPTLSASAMQKESIMLLGSPRHAASPDMSRSSLPQFPLHLGSIYKESSRQLQSPRVRIEAPHNNTTPSMPSPAKSVFIRTPSLRYLSARSLKGSATKQVQLNLTIDGLHNLKKDAFGHSTASVAGASVGQAEEDFRITPQMAWVSDLLTAPISTGKLLNSISVDADGVTDAYFSTTSALGPLFDLLATIIWIGFVVGWAAAALVPVMLLVFLFQVKCGALVAAKKVEVAAVCDQRLRACAEFLHGIQVVKFYAWERSVREMIRSIRDSEEALLLKLTFWKLMGITTIFFSNGIFSVVLFAVKLSYDDQMKASDTFVTVALLGSVARFFQALPKVVGAVGTASACFGRVEEFLSKDVTSVLPASTNRSDTANAAVMRRKRRAQRRKALSIFQDQKADSEAAPILMQPTIPGSVMAGSICDDPANAEVSDDTDLDVEEDVTIISDAEIGAPIKSLTLEGSFGWPGFAIADVHLVCPPGSLTVVMGSVGSGKTTLLQAIVGACAVLTPEKYKRELPSDQRIAYVPQEAFISNSTVRENITFGLPFDEVKYRKVINACSLTTDLQQWGGDLVEVTGATLSGGQRQRLSIARACYADATVYVIDDALSAVDATVANYLMDNCLRGFLRDKIVLLSTHHPAPAKVADQLVVLGGGKALVIDKHLHSSPRDAPSVTIAIEQPDETNTVLDSLIGQGRTLMKAEEEVQGAVAARVYKDYITGGGTHLFIACLFLFAASQGVRSVQDWWFSAWTANTFPELTNVESVGILALMVLLTIIASSFRTFVFGTFVIQASSSLHNNMLSAIFSSPLHFFDQVPTGRIINRFSRDVDNCDDFLARAFFDVFQQFFSIIGGFAMLIYSIPYIAIALPPTIGILFYLHRRSVPASRYLKRIDGSSRSPTMSTLQSTIAGLTTLRVFGCLGSVQGAFSNSMDATTTANWTLKEVEWWMAVRMDWVGVLLVAGVSVLCVALMDTLGASLVGLCLSQAVSLVATLQTSFRMASFAESAMTSAERLSEYGHLEPESEEGQVLGRSLDTSKTTTARSTQVEELSPKNDTSLVREIPEDALKDWPQNCDITVKGLTIRYVSNPQPTLIDMHFTIKAGQRIAVVGRTGAGKSSLLAAFYRTVEVPKNSITIGGVCTTQVNVSALRSSFGIIPQVPVLFYGTLRYNLDPFGRYTDADMKAVLIKVKMDGYARQRQGLDTIIGEGGGSLSVGQKQLLCVARVLLTSPVILFMDEATASIDEKTDAKIQEIIRTEALYRTMTIVTIAHRLNTIMDYDLVLVLSHGRLVEYGNPRSLVEAGLHETSGQDRLPPQAYSTSNSDFTTIVTSYDEVKEFAAMAKAFYSGH